jgi:hypothetical protein
MLRAAVDAALGRPVERATPRASHVRYRCVVFEHEGIADYDPRAMRDDAEGSGLIVTLDVEPGERVLPVEHPDGGVYGRIVAFGDSLAEVVAGIDRAERELALTLTPLRHA